MENLLNSSDFAEVNKSFCFTVITESNTLSTFSNAFSNSLYCLHTGLIRRLQLKLAHHGVKLSIPGLQGESDGPVPSHEHTEPSLVRLLALLCGLELNGNLNSELQQLVEKEQSCLLQDSLLLGLLDNQALRHCVDICMENSTPGKIKVLEVGLKSPTRLSTFRIPLQC